MANLKYSIGACFLAILLFELTIDAVIITEEEESKSNSDRRLAPRRSGSKNSGGRSESQTITAYTRTESRRKSGSSSRRKSSGRDNGNAIMQPDKKANLLKRMGSNIAISIKLPQLADVITLKSEAMESFHKYTEMAAKTRSEKEDKIDKMKLDEDLESAKEMWQMDVANVAYGYHKILDIIYGDIVNKKKDHCKEIDECIREMSFESEQKYNLHMELLDHINNALNIMKKDSTMVNKAIISEIDLLSMFHRISGNNVKYYKEYFDKNILNELFKIMKTVEDTVEAKFNKSYNKMFKKARDPHVTQQFVNARIAALRKRGDQGRTTRSGGTSKSKHNGDDNYSSSKYSRDDGESSEYYSRYSRSESRRSRGDGRGGDRRKSRSERSGKNGDSSRRRSPSRSRSGRSRRGN